MEIEIKIEGDKEIAAMLDRLEKNVGKKIVRKSVKDAQKIALERARGTVQSMVGGKMGALISKALAVLASGKRIGSKQRKGFYKVWVWIKPGVSEDEFIDISLEGVRNYVPAAIEYGHVKKGGGQVQPIPYMLTAALTTEQTRINKVKNDVKKGIKELA